MCKERLGNANGYICKECFNNLEIIHKEITIDSPYINKVYYSLLYNRLMREMVKKYKYEGKNYLYKAFGEIMMGTIKTNGLESHIDIIAYIPAHRRKEALRGYNQAELLASYIAEKLDKPLLKNNLVKLKWTEDQSHSNKAERIVNLKDSFHIKNPTEVMAKKILLVDDIITTGATMEECSRVLINNGAHKVIGLALTSNKKF